MNYMHHLVYLNIMKQKRETRRREMQKEKESRMGKTPLGAFAAY